MTDEKIVSAAAEVQAIVQRAGFAKFKDGSIVQSLVTGTRYRLENVHPTPSGVPCATVRRATPKVKGKAARKAERAARRASRGLV